MGMTIPRFKQVNAFMKKIAVILLAICPSIWAGENSDAFFYSGKVRDGGIPLPRETSYQQQGFGVGLGAGALFPSGKKCNTLAQWQGTLEYYYAPFLSAGGSVRMYGGNIDKQYMMIYQRYHTHLRLHGLLSADWSVFISPMFGFETTSLSEIREEKEENAGNQFGVSDEKKAEILGCNNEYDLDGFSGGFAVGSGYRLSEDWAVTGSAGVEYSTAGVGQLSLAFGVGFNIRNYWKFLNENLLGSWMVLEVLSHRYFTEETGAWGVAVLLALVLNI